MFALSESAKQPGSPKKGHYNGKWVWYDGGAWFFAFELTCFGFKCGLRWSFPLEEKITIKATRLHENQTPPHQVKVCNGRVWSPGSFWWGYCPRSADLRRLLTSAFSAPFRTQLKKTRPFDDGIWHLEVLCCVLAFWKWDPIQKTQSEVCGVCRLPWERIDTCCYPAR